MLWELIMTNIDLLSTLAEMGMDSLMATEVKQIMERECLPQIV